jgi:hypothetical protein
MKRSYSGLYDGNMILDDGGKIIMNGVKDLEGGDLRRCDDTGSMLVSGYCR